MNWSFWLVLLPTVCYLTASAAYFRAGNYPLSVTYAGYFIGNIGLLWLDSIMSKG